MSSPRTPTRRGLVRQCLRRRRPKARQTHLSALRGQGRAALPVSPQALLRMAHLAPAKACSDLLPDLGRRPTRSTGSRAAPWRLLSSPSFEHLMAAAIGLSVLMAGFSRSATPHSMGRLQTPVWPVRSLLRYLHLMAAAIGLSVLMVGFSRSATPHSMGRLQTPIWPVRSLLRYPHPTGAATGLLRLSSTLSGQARRAPCRPLLRQLADRSDLSWSPAMT